MSFFSNLVSSVGQQVGALVTDQVIAVLDPKVRAEVSEHVTEFKTGAVNDIPRTIESNLQAGQASDSVVTSMISNLLSGHTGPLLENLLLKMKPKIDAATAGLSDSITDEGMTYVRQFLDLSKTGDGQAAADGSQQAAADGSQSRGLDLSGGLNLDARLTSFLNTLREQLHPVFENLKPKIWELVPSTLQETLEQAFGQDSGQAVATPAVDQQPGQSTLSMVGDFFKGAMAGQVVQQAPQLLTLVQEPVQGVIANIVDTLETKCNDAFGARLREQMSQFHLL